MSRSVDKRRVARKYARELDLLYGDGRDLVYGEEEAGQEALLYSGALAELAKTAGSIAAQKQKADAIKVAKQLRSEADAAAKKAQSEKDPNGLLHRNAADLDERARVAELKAGMSSPSPSAPEITKSSKGVGGTDTSKYLMYGLLGVGGLIGVAVLVKLFKK